MTSAPPLIWAFEERGGRVPYGPGLVELGLDPAAITLLRLADPSSVLRAGLDALRTGAATVLIELHGSQPLLDLTASRRLAFAAQQSGALALLCRGNAPPGPSAAHSRWQVAAAPSRALLDGSDLNAPGHPAFTLTLLRQRGGRDGLNLLLEWERDTYSFREYRPGFHEYHKADDIPDIGQSACHLQPSLPGVVSALAAGRAGGGRGPGLG
jgi:protein ImuA